MKHIILKMIHHLLVPDDFISNLGIMEDVDINDEEEMNDYFEKHAAFDSTFQFRGHLLEPHMVWLEMSKEKEYIKANTVNAIDDLCMDEIEAEVEMECIIMEPKYRRINYDDDVDDDPEIYSEEERQNINIEEGMDKNDMTQWYLYINDDDEEE